MDEVTHRQATHVFDASLVPEPVLRWAVEQASDKRDLPTVLLETGFISPEVARRLREQGAEGFGKHSTAELAPDELPPSQQASAIAFSASAGSSASIWGPSSIDPSSVDSILPSEPGAYRAPPSTEEPAPGSLRRLGPYALLRELGRGAMGVVYEAEHTVLRRRVALKVIRRDRAGSSQALRRFEVEARAMARLRHPNIVPILDVSVDGPEAYMVMEMATGGTLLDRMKARKKLPPDDVVRLLQLLAGALEHAHAHSVIHRDVKPANVLFTAAGQPLISDFGLAKPVDLETALSRSGSMVGTPAYMSPEQMRGHTTRIDGRADLYALGVTAFEAITGRLPFEGQSFERFMRAVLYQPAPPLARFTNGVSADVETIVARCLSKDPSERYASAADLAEDCRRHLAKEPIAARPVGRLERLDLWRRRQPGLAGLVLAGAFV
ncbi:serine/threonine protein kinase, partial [Planctomycetota bacterium]|nr:serine/threonine protein kinase [Planctomycetota bacterium]